MSTDTPTSCLGNPQPVTCGTTSITLRWHLTSSITLETTLPSNEGSGLTPRPGFHQAGHGLDSVPSRTNITHYPRPELSAREAKFSFHKTRPHPLAGSQPSEKKGGGVAAGIGKFKVCHASSPPAALHPTAFLPPPHSRGINCPMLLPPQKSGEIPSPLASTRLPPATQTKALGPRGPRRAAPSQRSSSPSPEGSG